LSRPQFRELAPFLYYDSVRRRTISGNPNLEDTRIHNADVRLEWFSDESEVLAVSSFYKHFTRPIEQVVVSSAEGGDLSFANAPQASSVGAELEARVSLARLHRALAPFRAGGNVSLIRSSVQLGDSTQLQTNRRRPLQGQSPYVVNLNLGWVGENANREFTLFYNVYGPRISEVGFDQLPDVNEQPFHRVDVAYAQGLAKSLRLKMSVANLLNGQTVFTQGSVEVFRFRPGLTGSAALEWSL
jgi:outer membrane receptor for ferrienterochelin and colicin